MDKHLKRVLRVIDQVEDWFLIIMLAIMVLLAVVQIFYRNIFGLGINWADPLLRTLVLWVALMGAVIASRTNNHIRIDFFTRFIPSIYRGHVERIVFFFSFSVCAFIAWQGFRFTASEYEYGAESFLNIPSWVTVSIIPIGFLLMSFRYLILLIWPPTSEGQTHSEVGR